MTVRVDRDGGVAAVTFSAPPLNLYSLDLHADLDRALDAIEADRPRVLVFGAEGKLVSAGVDVAQFAACSSREETQALYDRMMELPERIADLDVPTIFAAHGLTLTWAFEVALACDLLLATTDARFGLVERVIGLTPTMGGTQRLAARAGTARAKEFVFTGAAYEAATLERWNVVNRVVAPEDFDTEIQRLAADLAKGPTRAFGAAKDILRHYETGGLTAANAATTTIASALYDTADLQHGMASFLTDGPGKATFGGH